MREKNIQIAFGTEYQIHVHTPPHTPTHTHPPHTPPAHTGTYIISTPTTESDQRLGIIVRTANTVRQSLAHSAVL